MASAHPRPMMSVLVLVSAAIASYQVACSDDSDSNVAGPPTTINSSTSSSSSSSGNRGEVFVPGGPNVDGPDAATGGSPTNSNEGVVCNGVALGLGTLDQSQLEESGAIFLTPTTGEPTQSFTPSVDGYLTGIELYLQRASVGTGETSGKILVELREATAIQGSGTIDLAKLPLGDARGTLSGPPGVGYVAMGANCRKLKAGTTYGLKLQLIGVPDGVCTGDTCTIGRVGDTCTKNSECDYRIRIAMTSNSKYDGGALSGFANNDVIFRSYMQP